MGWGRVGTGRVGTGLFRAGSRHDVLPPGRVRGEDAVVADEVEARTWNEGGEFFDKLQWREKQVGGPIGYHRTVHIYPGPGRIEPG
jgi:hypothetical protein